MPFHNALWRRTETTLDLEMNQANRLAVPTVGLLTDVWFGLPTMDFDTIIVADADMRIRVKVGPYRMGQEIIGGLLFSRVQLAFGSEKNDLRGGIISTTIGCQPFVEVWPTVFSPRRIRVYFDAYEGIEVYKSVVDRGQD